MFNKQWIWKHVPTYNNNYHLQVPTYYTSSSNKDHEVGYDPLNIKQNLHKRSLKL